METENREGIGRFYLTPKGSYPSVTTVLAASQDHSFLDEWRARIGEEEANRISKESTDIGTHLHYLFECELQGLEKPEPENAEQVTATRMFKISLPKLRAYVKEVVAMETPVWSDQFRVAGRFDLLCVNKHGRLCLLDFKNSRRAKTVDQIQNYRQQLGFYTQMIKETLGKTVEDQTIFMVTREGFVQQFQFKPEDTPRSELVAIRKNFWEIHHV